MDQISVLFTLHMGLDLGALTQLGAALELTPIRVKLKTGGPVRTTRFEDYTADTTADTALFNHNFWHFWCAGTILEFAYHIAGNL